PGDPVAAARPHRRPPGFTTHPPGYGGRQRSRARLDRRAPLAITSVGIACGLRARRRRAELHRPRGRAPVGYLRCVAVCPPRRDNDRKNSIIPVIAELGTSHAQRQIDSEQVTRIRLTTAQISCNRVMRPGLVDCFPSEETSSKRAVAGRIGAIVLQVLRLLVT